MLQTILSTLLQKPLQNNVSNVKNQENLIPTPKPPTDDTKRKRPADTFEEHSSSKNSRSSSISTTEANFMDTENPDLTQHQLLSQVHNTRNTKVNFPSLPLEGRTNTYTPIAIVNALFPHPTMDAIFAVHPQNTTWAENLQHPLRPM